MIFFLLVGLILMIHHLDKSSKTNTINSIEGSVLTIQTTEFRQDIQGLKPMKQSYYDSKSTHYIEKGSSLPTILKDAGFSNTDSESIMEIISKHISPENILLNSKYTIYYTDSLPTGIEIQLDSIRSLYLRRTPENIFQGKIQKQLYKQEEK